MEKCSTRSLKWKYLTLLILFLFLSDFNSTLAIYWKLLIKSCKYWPYELEAKRIEHCSIQFTNFKAKQVLGNTLYTLLLNKSCLIILILGLVCKKRLEPWIHAVLCYIVPPNRCQWWCFILVLQALLVLTKVRRIMWHIFFDMWEARNQVVHGHNTASKTRASHKKIANELRFIHSKRNEVLTTDRDILLEAPKMKLRPISASPLPSTSQTGYRSGGQ